MFADNINELFSSQLSDWQLARINYGLLQKVRTRRIDFGTFEVLIQFNPERIRSSSAKVDKDTINERPCFLCPGNRPPEQRGVPFEENLTALVNPYPVFKRHLTIVSDIHTDQRIKNNLGAMLRLAEALPSFTVFYNGPQCGASAPDHFHFQAGSAGFIPLESDWLSGKNTILISGSDDIEIWLWKGFRRGIITLAGINRDSLSASFMKIYERLEGTQPGNLEPMVNILVNYSGSAWFMHIIPRRKHRPSQFFMEGDRKILVSPAAVDLGGMLITPREEDFDKITKEEIEDIFGQVCYGEDELLCITNDIL